MSALQRGFDHARSVDVSRPRIAAAICVHGAGGGAWEWALWRGVFEAAGLACLAIELQPAAGGLASTRFDDYVDQVHAAVAHAPRPRALIGASLGGLLALRCAEEADALVLVNALPPAPWALQLPARTSPDVVAWGADARLASTRRALPDADEATVIEAMRRWRDESGQVLREARAGIRTVPPRCPVLCLASGLDDDVPAALTADLAAALGADLMRYPTLGHVDPLLGRSAANIAAAVAAWLAQR
ncbi:alpha/beta fold hydrolase [Lysobacter korlensis]|uniref:Alpha/beta fold hydrolase n=1 Tax=Lysobacter korlensis TaxID=553636 RepID=A0ABV6RPE1_9GAMM